MKTPSATIGTFRLFLLYFGCYGIVIGYVHTFIIWVWLRNGMGATSNLLPFVAVTVIAVMVGGLLIILRKRGSHLKKWWIVAAAVCTAVALTLPDPELPAKRIHVAQYFLLAFLVRYPLSFRLQGIWLTIFVFLVTVLFGIHDELMQGLHPLRTFGLRDICVNSLAALAGACLGQGAELFPFNCRQYHEKDKAEDRCHVPSLYVVVFLILCVAVAGMLVPLPYFTKNSIPMWLISPLVGCLCATVLFAPEAGKSCPAQYHGFVVIFWLLLSLPLYLVIANVALVEFN